MIQIICDKCGINCGRVALEIRVSVIENPTPTHALDTGDLKITSDHSKYRFILCQKCFHEMGFPNPYIVCDTKQLRFRDDEDEVSK